MMLLDQDWGGSEWPWKSQKWRTNLLLIQFPVSIFSSPAVPLGDTANASYFGSWSDVRCVTRKLPKHFWTGSNFFSFEGEKNPLLLLLQCSNVSIDTSRLICSSTYCLLFLMVVAKRFFLFFFFLVTTWGLLIGTSSRSFCRYDGPSVPLHPLLYSRLRHSDNQRTSVEQVWCWGGRAPSTH